MDMLRDIAGGLVVPGMAEMGLGDVIRRAAADASFKGGTNVAAQVDDSLREAPDAVKITAYRVVQEALANSLRHAAGTRRVLARRDGGDLVVEVGDDGPGFDADSPVAEGHLGLAFLRERVQLLSGTLELRSAPGQGTLLRARIPLSGASGPHG